MQVVVAYLTLVLPFVPAVQGKGGAVRDRLCDRYHVVCDTAPVLLYITDYEFT